MKKYCLLIAFLQVTLLAGYDTNAQSKTDSLLPLRGLCIAAPSPAGVDSFSTFIATVLAPRNVNTLILRVDFNYRFVSHPELSDSIALSKEDIKKTGERVQAKQYKAHPANQFTRAPVVGHQNK